MPQNMDDPFGLPFEDLPQILLIFSLPGAILLPHDRMPLNIFEPPISQSWRD
jgi:Lon protease-like protein